MTTPRSFAVVPAAGHSRRMGEPKLLLPWRGTTLIEHVLAAWLDSQVTRVAVVVRGADDELLRVCRRLPVEVVCPEVDPRDMKESVQWGLRRHEQHGAGESDVWLLAPADMPHLTASLVDQVLAAHDAHDPRIVIPTAGGRAGHPVLFPWSLSQRVFTLAKHEGVNRITKEFSCRRLEVEARECFEDVDTMEEYRRAVSRSDADD